MDRVYLAEAEHHHPDTPRSVESLRASLALHVLFARQLVVGDSQVLNNRVFRQLVCPTSATLMGEEFSSLCASGRVKIALREGATFSDIANDHARRGVSDVPSVEYAAMLDEALGADSLDRWELDAVATSFRDRVIRRLQDDTTAKLIAEADSTRFATWVSGQESLQYSRARDYLQSSYPSQSAAALDALVGLEYRNSLPHALRVAVADSSRRHDPLFYARTRPSDGVTSRTITTWVFSPEALATIPFSAVIEASRLPARHQVEAELKRLETHGTCDVDGLESAFRDLFARLEVYSLEMAHGNVAEALGVLRQRKVGLRLGALRTTALTTGASIFLTSAVDGLPSLAAVGIDFAILASSAYGELRGDQAARETQLRLALQRRLNDSGEARTLYRAVAPLIE